MTAKPPNIGRTKVRPLEKCVDVKNVRDWVPEPLRRRVDLTDAWGIIKRHYCAALVTRGVCPIQCENCREAIVRMFDLSEAKNPAALLTWRAKDQSAAMIEKLIAAQHAVEFPAPEIDTVKALFQRPKEEGNLFSELLEDYQ